MENTFLMPFFKTITEFAKRDIILMASVVLAAVSCFFIHPDVKYLEYIDIKTIIILFCLMLIVEALREADVFTDIGNIILGKIKTQRGIILSLVTLCFVSSMFITNDVALITFIPLALIVLESTNMTEHLCLTVVFMTIASNLGSMLTPIGNPQNVYLFSISKMDITGFILIMLPYTLISLLLLGIIISFRYDNSLIKASGHTGSANVVYVYEEPECPKAKNRSRCIIYGILFALCIPALMGYLNIYILLAVVSICMFFIDRKLFTRIDYSLLLTFICFFIFIGNISRFGAFQNNLISLLSGHEKLISIGVSQIISNVPAALLLSGYSADIKDILVGTNLGGLGTLIASMASLISYKQLVRKYPHLKKKYIITFTLFNLLFLSILYILSLMPMI